MRCAANYTVQYQLTPAITAGVPAGLANITGGTNGTFYNDGTVLSLTAATPVADGPGNSYVFTSWTGHVPSPPNLSNPLSVTMNQARTIWANYAYVSLAWDSTNTFSAQYSDSTGLKALVQIDGSAAAGISVSFQVGSDTGSASTGSDGIATDLTPITQPEGSPTATASATVLGALLTITHSPFTITKEDATATFDPNNPTAIPVASPGGSAPQFTLKVDLREAYAGGSEPNPASTSLQAAGDIDNATITMSLSPVGPGSSYNGNCSYSTTSVTDYTQVRTATCTFSAGVQVNAYSILVTVTGNYYTGSAEDVITIYDPSLGFTTGGGFVYWPGTADPGSGYLGDRTNFGFNMKYNKKGTSPQGSVLVLRHRQNGTIVRLKSNSLDALSLGTIDPVGGWATITGKATFFDSEGNNAFIFYVEDLNEPGTGTDRAWVQATGRTELSLAPTGSANAVTINGGNIVVPHTAPGRTK